MQGRREQIRLGKGDGEIEQSGIIKGNPIEAYGV